MGRVLPLDMLLSLREQWRRNGQRMVFTNGCFDLIHVGHVRYLQRARTLGDVLVVGLNSDASTRHLKGNRRPIVPQDDRAEIVAALGAVDYVVIFDDPTAEPLVSALRPDVYVKGGDYAITPDEEGKDLPEARIVAAYGGQVVIIPLVEGRSTSDIITLVVERYCRSPEPR